LIAAPATVAASDAQLAGVIAAGAEEMRLPLAAAQIDSLVAYLRLLERWSSTYNLTSVRDPLLMASQHILDCLSVVGPLRRRRGVGAAGRLLDVGSGAGLPGVVIALALPDIDVTCVDSVGKKSAFVTHAAAALRLGNVAARHTRVEELAAMPPFDVIASRAFGPLADLVSATRRLVAPAGIWMAMKGKVPEAELTERVTGVRFHVEPLQVPGLDAERCIVWGECEASGNGVSASYSPPPQVI
jgi:16S rRNA (guanine527-N7)-methyltransferase